MGPEIPHMNRMTDTCGNITFPTTSLVGGILVHPSEKGQNSTHLLQGADLFSLAVECALIRVPMSGCDASSRFDWAYWCGSALDGNYGTDWATSGEGIGSWIKVFILRSTVLQRL